MTIQWSLVLFTVVAGCGGWVFSCGAAQSAFQGKTKLGQTCSLIGAVLLVLGGLISVTHLSHPDRMLAALGHPTSGIFTEAALIGMLIVFAVAFLIASKRNAGPGALKALAVCGVALAAVFSFACGSSYMMSSRPAWDTIAIPASYFGTVTAAGLACYAFAAKLADEDAFAAKPVSTLLLGGAGAAAVTLAAVAIVDAEWFGTGVAAFALACVGSVAAPLAGGIVLRKSGTADTAVLGACAAAAVIGAIALRVFMWQTGVPSMDCFGTVL